MKGFLGFLKALAWAAAGGAATSTIDVLGNGTAAAPTFGHIGKAAGVGAILGLAIWVRGLFGNGTTPPTIPPGSLGLGTQAAPPAQKSPNQN